jgi:hypothetical protein
VKRQFQRGEIVFAVMISLDDDCAGVWESRVLKADITGAILMCERLPQLGEFTQPSNWIWRRRRDAERAAALVALKGQW